MIKSFLRYIHLYLLKKQLRFHHAVRKVSGLENAREIGILFDASDTDQTAIVNTFADSLRKQRKKLMMLGFYNFSKPALNLNFPYFNKKNLNWYREPQGLLVDDFMSRKFDILINAYIEENLPLEFISSMSQAGFRIGHYHPEKIYAYDMMIDLKGDKNLGKLTEEIKRYLSMVESNGKGVAPNS